MDKDGLKAKALVLIQSPASSGRRYRLTLLEIRGITAMRAQAGIDAVEVFIARLGDRLSGLSLQSKTAGQLTDTTFAVIHTEAVIPDVVARAAVDTAEECAIMGASVDTVSLTLDADTRPATESAHALAFLLNAVATDIHGESIHIATANIPLQLSQIVDAMKRVHRAIAERDFDIVFQPIVALGTMQVHHFECLVRFKENGDRSPYISIVFAEDTGLIGELDLEVLRRVIAMMNSANPGLRFAVNLSGRSLADHRITGAVRRMLRGAPHLAGRLLLEITESAAITDLPAANAVVQEIRRMGFEVGLDDFGAGSAAFHYLRALRVDHIKIDGSYIRGSTSNKENRAFVKAIVGLCTDLGIATIAEYVEDAATAAMLKDMNVGYGQGWHFGKPCARAPADDPAWTPPGTEWRQGALYFTG